MKEIIADKVEIMRNLERDSVWGLTYIIVSRETHVSRMISLKNLCILTNDMTDGIIDISFQNFVANNTVVILLNKETYDKIVALQTLDHLFSNT